MILGKKNNFWISLLWFAGALTWFTDIIFYGFGIMKLVCFIVTSLFATVYALQTRSSEQMQSELDKIRANDK